uniref:Uncharacterized protein n=1 Tax=Romanomermis culicivorax TaxID=13658 RepID=A0A915KGS3_ROMCU
MAIKGKAHSNKAWLTLGRCSSLRTGHLLAHSRKRCKSSSIHYQAKLTLKNSGPGCILVASGTLEEKLLLLTALPSLATLLPPSSSKSPPGVLALLLSLSDIASLSKALSAMRPNLIKSSNNFKEYSVLGDGFKGQTVGPADGGEAGLIIRKRFGME